MNAAPDIYGDMQSIAWRRQCYRWAWANFGLQYAQAELYYKCLCQRLQAELLLATTPVWTDDDEDRLHAVKSLLRDNRDGIRRIDDLWQIVHERSALENKRDVYRARSGAARESLAQARRLAAALDPAIKKRIDKAYLEQKK